MKVKVYEIYEDGRDLYKELEDVLSITISSGNYVVVLSKEDYFQKLVHLFNIARFKLEVEM